MRKSKKSVKKKKISFRRKISIYYQNFVLLLKFLLLSLVVLFIFTDLFDNFKIKFFDIFYKESIKYGFELKNVSVAGQKNAEYKDIITSLGKDKGDSIFSVDLHKTKEILENHRWIKTAIVERRLPSTISIAIIERKPVAVWQFEQKLYLVDSEGNRIAKYQNNKLEELIHVVGQDANIYAKTLLDDLNRYPGLASKVKSAVRYGGRRWNLNLKQNITVKMPENNFNEAYDYLHLMNKNDRLFDQNYKLLDLRDSYKYYLEKY